MVSIVIGVLLVVFGLGLYAAGIAAFGSFKRASGLEPDKLVTSGIYRWNRNPQMVGCGMLLLGVALIGRSVLALILVALFWLMFRLTLVVEEEYLEQVFGEEYRTYCSITPRYLGLLRSRHR